MIRRDLLKLGSLATAGLAFPAPLFAAVDDAQAMSVIVDPRFKAALAFADAARGSGARVFASEGDLVSVWHGPLRGASPAGLRGLTGYGDMVVAGGLAAAARRPFSFRMSHHVAQGEQSHRQSIGSPAQADVLQAAGEQWPLALWSLMSAGSGAPGNVRARRTEAAGREGTLWSWAIA
ncbi:hypothetical protein SLG_38100 [Sphingobium sp. SYK-6]|uniref:hypothetical protein n=1 Tax=Sphingobium sp. (strain NBRC 103272 / SYK-6) TaxID=627192 RepID=UPI0002277F5D|nr:hypothetical protein [Sphingobium sp. SYK-6]BAK68485.1 hypothetical protein SLG_38100 [Sphingobium sp. SYK-6]